MELPFGPEPFTLIGKAVAAVVGSLRRAPQGTLSERAVLQEIRVIASPGATIIPQTVTGQPVDGRSMLDALVKDVLLILQSVDGIEIEFQIGPAGERRLRIRKPASFAAPGEDEIVRLAHERERYLQLPAVVAPPVDSGSDPAHSRAPAAPPIDPRTHASQALREIMEEPW